MKKYKLSRLRGIELAESFARLLASRQDKIFIAHKHRELIEIDWLDGLPLEPYAVHLSRENRVRYLVIDVDDIPLVYDYENLVSSIKRFPHVECISGPRKNRHFYLPLSHWVDQDEVRFSMYKMFLQKRLDLGPQRQSLAVIRPPFSPHSWGGRSKIVGDPWEALEVLSFESSNFYDIIQSITQEDKCSSEK